MDIPEKRQNPLIEAPVDADPEDLAIFDKGLEEPNTRAEIFHHVLTENPTKTQRPDPPLLIDSEEIDVLKQEVHITEQDRTALTAHPRK